MRSSRLVQRSKTVRGSPRPGAHIETNYEFEIGAFHVGPSIELAVDLEDVHVMVGLHLGVGIG